MGLRDDFEYLLPIIRHSRNRKRHFVAIYSDGIITGRLSGNNPDAEVLLADEAFARLQATPGARDCQCFYWHDVTGIDIAKIEGVDRSRVVVRSSVSKWAGVLPIVADSLAFRVLGELCPVELNVQALLPSRTRRVWRIFAAVATGSLALGGTFALLANHVGLGGFLLGLALIMGLLGWWQWKARDPKKRPHVVIPHSKPAVRRSGIYLLIVFFVAMISMAVSSVMENLSALGISSLIFVLSLTAIVWLNKRYGRPLAHLPAPPPAARTRYSPRLGLFLRLAGLAALFSGYYLSNLASESISSIKSMQSNANAHWLIHMLCVMPGVMLIIRGYVISRPDGVSILRADSRPPILYLRSFGDDGKYTFTESTVAADLCTLLTPDRLQSPNFLVRYLNLNRQRGGWSVLSLPLRMLQLTLGRGSDTAEEQLANALRPYGPVVAIGNPTEALPTPGAAKFYVSHDEWQERVAELIRESKLVIIQASKTEGVRWEVATSLQLLADAPERLVISLKAANDDDARDEILLNLARIFGRRLPVAAKFGDFLAFDPGWGVRPLHLQTANPFRWPWLGTSADLAATLKPVMNRLTNIASTGPMAIPQDVLPSHPQPMKGLRFARFAASSIYGVGPLVLIFLSIFLTDSSVQESSYDRPVTYNSVPYEPPRIQQPPQIKSSRPWSTQTRTIQNGAIYTATINDAWTESPGAPEGICLLKNGDTKGLIIAAERRTANDTLIAVDEAYLETQLKSATPDSRRIERSPTSLRIIGNWPWIHTYVVCESTKFPVRNRIGIWCLETPSLIYVIMSREELLSNADHNAWDPKFDSTVETMIATLKPWPAIIPEATDQVKLGVVFQPKDQTYAVRLASNWTPRSNWPTGVDAHLENATGQSLLLYDLPLDTKPSFFNPVALAKMHQRVGTNPKTGTAIRIDSTGWIMIKDMLMIRIQATSSGIGRPKSQFEIYYVPATEGGYAATLLMGNGVTGVTEEERNKVYAMILSLTERRQQSIPPTPQPSAAGLAPNIRPLTPEFFSGPLPSSEPREVRPTDRGPATAARTPGTNPFPMPRATQNPARLPPAATPSNSPTNPFF